MRYAVYDSHGETPSDWGLEVIEFEAKGLVTAGITEFYETLENPSLHIYRLAPERKRTEALVWLLKETMDERTSKLWAMLLNEEGPMAMKEVCDLHTMDYGIRIYHPRSPQALLCTSPAEAVVECLQGLKMMVREVVG